LGLHLIPLLLQDGAKVRSLARHSSAVLEKLGVEQVEGSILDQTALDNAAKGVSGIFHLAGLVIHSRYQPKDLFETNVTGTLNVMKAAKQAGCRVVFASTSGTVGCSKNPKFMAHDASPYCLTTVGNWPYYKSKIEAETIAKRFAEHNDVELVILRPSIILGPGDVTVRSTRIIFGFLSRSLVTPSGGVSFVDVRDVAKAFLHAMTKGIPGKSYLLASYNSTIREWFQMLEEISGVKAPVYLGLPDPIWLALFNVLDFVNRKVKGKWNPVVDPVRAEMAIHYWSVYATAAYADLDFKPINPRKTLEDTVNWVKENKSLYLSKL